MKSGRPGNTRPFVLSQTRSERVVLRERLVTRGGQARWLDREIAAQFGIGNARIVRPDRDDQRNQASSHKEDAHLTSPFSAAKAEPQLGGLRVF